MPAIAAIGLWTLLAGGGVWIVGRGLDKAGAGVDRAGSGALKLAAAAAIGAGAYHYVSRR